MEASCAVVVIFTLYADVNVDPFHTLAVVINEEAVAFSIIITFNSAAWSIRVNRSSSDILGIEECSVGSLAISWSLVPSVEVWVVEFSESSSNSSNLGSVFSFQLSNSDLSFSLDLNMSFRDGSKRNLVHTLDGDLDV